VSRHSRARRKCLLAVAQAVLQGDQPGAPGQPRHDDPADQPELGGGGVEQPGRPAGGAVAVPQLQQPQGEGQKGGGSEDPPGAGSAVGEVGPGRERGDRHGEQPHQRRGIAVAGAQIPAEQHEDDRDLQDGRHQEPAQVGDVRRDRELDLAGGRQHGGGSGQQPAQQRVRRPGTGLEPPFPKPRGGCRIY